MPLSRIDQAFARCPCSGPFSAIATIIHDLSRKSTKKINFIPKKGKLTRNFIDNLPFLWIIWQRFYLLDRSSRALTSWSSLPLVSEMVLWKIYLESSLSTEVHDRKSIWHPPPADEYNHAMPPCQACGILPLAKNSDCPNDHRLLNGTCKGPNIWSHTAVRIVTQHMPPSGTTQRIVPITRCVPCSCPPNKPLLWPEWWTPLHHLLRRS